jgi:hypothetical protein
MNKPLISLSTLCLVLVAACPAEQTTTAPDPGATMDASASTGETPATGSSEAGETQAEDSTTGSELPGPDAGIGDGQCDPWAQDCPAGYKCMAYAPEDEFSFTGNKCTAVVDAPKAIGDPCHVEGGWWSGIDDCDYGLVCWDINHDTNEGQCVAMCTGSAEAAECPSSADVCAFWVTGISHVCLRTCDPLVQDCTPGQACLPEWGSNAEEWVCKAEYSFDEGQEFDPCAYSNVCNPGLVCWDPSKAIECTDPMNGCCLSLCDLGDPQCNGAGAECTPFYDTFDGEAPPEFGNVGLCVLPG